MDASTIYLPVLVLHFSSSVASEGRFGATQGVVLPGSVFQTFRRTTLQQCRRLCVYSSRCLSVNWSSSTRECQLNSEKGDRERLLLSDTNIYLTVQQMKHKGHPCGNQPCSANDMCIPVNSAKAHACLCVDEFMTQTTEAGMPSQTATTTTATASTTSSQIAAETTSTAVPTKREITTTDTTPTTATTTTFATTTTTIPTATIATTSRRTTPTTTAPTSTQDNGACETDSDCAVPPGRTCSGGICICPIGYDMDETRVKCRILTECSSFRSDFILYVDKLIKGYAIDKYLYYTTPADCASFCLNATSMCRSFEMENTFCYLQAVTWFAVPQNKRASSPGSNHHQRRCAW